MPLAALRVLAVTAVMFSSFASAQTIIKPETPAATTSKAAEPKYVTLPARKLIFVRGRADLDNVYGAVVDALKKVHTYLDKEGIAPAGPAMARYTDSGDTGFQFEAGYPVADAPKSTPSDDIAVGDAPAGKFLDFVHRGAFDKIDETYSAIDDYFAARGQQSGGGAEADEDNDVLADSFEQYTTDPLTTGPDKVEVHVMVPAK